MSLFLMSAPVSEHYHLKAEHRAAEVERVFKRTLEGKNLSGCHICHKSKWLI